MQPLTRPMFGCLAIYIEEKIVLVLRKRQPADADNGIWIATSHEHHSSLKKEFPNLRSIKIFGDNGSSWQVLPEKSSDFEEAAMHACELVLRNDPRIGKTPQKKRRERKFNGSY